jgi:hypothetical protein
MQCCSPSRGFSETADKGDAPVTMRDQVFDSIPRAYESLHDHGNFCNLELGGKDNGHLRCQNYPLYNGYIKVS